MDTIKISEIFTSIQGESHLAGYPCCFVRLTGCNLTCFYCDTRYAMDGGKVMRVQDVVEEVLRADCPLAEVTGGEPLLQPGALHLLSALLETGLKVMVETNGSLDVSSTPKGVKIIMDLKTPGSGMESFNRLENLNFLKPDDEVKFVCVDRNDYEWTKKILSEQLLPKGVLVNISPVCETLAPAELAKWMLEDRLQARFQIQLHRVVWPEQDRGV